MIIIRQKEFGKTLATQIHEKAIGDLCKSWGGRLKLKTALKMKGVPSNLKDKRGIPLTDEQKALRYIRRSGGDGILPEGTTVFRQYCGGDKIQLREFNRAIANSKNIHNVGIFS